MGSYDEIFSMVKKFNLFYDTMDVSTILKGLVYISIIILIIAGVNESMLDSNIVIVALISIFVGYIYIKKLYNKKIKKLKLKNKILKKNSVLDEICSGNTSKNRKLCRSYNMAKKNFYTISNMLLQKYNIKD
tara:strand:+ start:487 stop:882 length:396 start_codon:yes stop_codon:yes gene_type:complete